MAKFLDTTGISYRLAQMIKEAEEKVVLISPYIKGNDRIKELLEDKEKFKIDIRLIYGKKGLQPEELAWIKELGSIRSSFCKDLHAKCYLSEKEAIVTSMNLYEFSQQNNNEMGIYITKSDDPKLYNDIAKEVKRLIRISDELTIYDDKGILKEKLKTKRKKGIEKKVEIPKKGFCIRCKKEIEPNPGSAYCPKCLKTWNEFKNKKYEEKYCHICGISFKSSMDKPTCYNCYKKFNKIMDFPLKD